MHLMSTGRAVTQYWIQNICKPSHWRCTSTRESLTRKIKHQFAPIPFFSRRLFTGCRAAASWGTRISYLKRPMRANMRLYSSFLRITMLLKIRIYKQIKDALCDKNNHSSLVELSSTSCQLTTLHTFPHLEETCIKLFLSVDPSVFPHRSMKRGQLRQ